jgi:hypothetical protein
MPFNGRPDVEMKYRAPLAPIHRIKEGRSGEATAFSALEMTGTAELPGGMDAATGVALNAVAVTVRYSPITALRQSIGCISRRPI